jgi:hypothetical protein
MPNIQSPISTTKLQNQIDLLSKAYPGREVIVITNPGATVKDLPYRIIQCPDESYDMYLLSRGKIIVMSKSTFSLCAALFGDHVEIHMPLIGFLVVFGFSTKYDRSTCVYF